MSVIVWGRDNDYKVCTPYPPEVSNGIEKIFSANKSAFQNLGRIQLGPFSPDYAEFSIDTAIMKQCQTSSGRRFAVERSIMGRSSALAKGYVWEFEGDTQSHWFAYDISTMTYLEETYSKLMKRRPKSKKRQPIVNMKGHFQMQYVIDVEKMQQTRADTGKVRNIQRRPLTQAYMPDQSYPWQSPLSSGTAMNVPVFTRSSLKRRNVAASGGAAQQTAGTLASKQQPTPPAPIAAAAAAVNQPSAPSAVKKSATKKQQGLGSSQQKAGEEREPLPLENKIRIVTKKLKAARPAEEVLQQYATVIKVDEENYGSNSDVDTDEETEGQENQHCSICCDKLSTPSGYGEGEASANVVVQLKRCGHKFHRLCLLEMYKATHKNESLQCPTCKLIYGEKTGICPAGVMKWTILHGASVAGYEGYDTISVSYHIEPGVQGPEHPKPGQPFFTQGFPRVGYLPDTNEGRKVLKLMIEAWRRRLMFTVGTSYTTGSSDVVTWNEIHHKTELHGNYFGHGYPDPSYLANVILELADHGVTEDCL
ncbi:hypothetical protein RRG08_042109 [Elysia crispata]|uniref:E3 ubiquitin-protein ligase n=1 Tax=Elysia crispata TaxID=231223 RepID=A0AAE0Z0Y0_9GAST|nr:hypothetical protein RRG08_042109 [Elysia crispata]